jgi:hypothetical protein
LSRWELNVENEINVLNLKFTMLSRKYQHDWLYLQSINSDKHLPESPFLDDDI